ncbi:MAG TPA: hypothetical protein VF629_22750 [Hymenobacter sp.]|jgi:hypothetical protein|uniref:hypothetical protein n=1 Tax=Hymenobacter sp. TaxID=1898978 RepID=UPI002ED8B344
MSLRPIPITEQLDWLVVNRENAASNLLGLPQIFEAYLRILPPLGIDPSISLTDYPFAKRTVADLNIRAAFWNQHGIINGQPNPERLESITYREVADVLGLKYNAEFDSDSIRSFYGEWPPHLGSSATLNEAFVQQLAQTIGPESDAYFYGSVDEGNYDWDKDGFPIDWLESGTAADLLEVYRRDGQLPTYTFATNHAWCLYQSEPIDSLVIGCAAHMAQALLTNPKLEVLPLPSL